MATVKIIVKVLLIIANVLLLLCVAWFARGKRDKASKIGFGIMEVVYVANIVLAIGGMIEC